MTSSNSLYDHDFFAWSNQQAALLRAGKLSQADIENIAGEIESMGKSEKRELLSRLTVLMMHLLKWQFQKAKRTTSWELTIDEQRIQLALHLADNPSLKSELPQTVHDAYRLAILGARRQTRLPASAFPAICPYSTAEMMDAAFWPD